MEILAVVAVLGIIALVAQPDASAGDAQDLDLAAARVAGAIRFARSEAIRRESSLGIDLDTATARVRVFRSDLGTTPPAPVFDVLDPLSFRPYSVDLGSTSAGARISLASTVDWNTSCATDRRILFDSTSAGRCESEWSVLLASLDVVLSIGEMRRTVRLDGETGRVTVQ